ncbi:hypothetical protein NZD89_23625 [Alicyclobacillus fastidiosus]|uniref:Uncharacterized protein n=1 Tax=Alicyclobacillus fastidiosus TaxID=392011 RepID=A0ABY6ZEH1_9BACL|nr:hypothetical protein [Alicyclobacillus fastidiosus]WAH41218.1 hypothetical protein NZD89_23625 [Alicyclobacillus fastidiosus]GMA62802.1 hypothetical protein GCM10025859_32420 [Alicyclobacillus fastidiosus]
MAEQDNAEASLLSTVFLVGAVSVGHMEGASCLNVGNNFPTNFRSVKKHNQGFGNVTGDHNTMKSLRSLLSDPDVLDAVSFKNDTEIPDWVVKVIETSQRAKED